MGMIGIGLVVLLVVIALVITQKTKAGKGAGGNTEAPWPYYTKKPLSTPEQVLYHRLVAALPEHIVLAQVQLSRLLGVKRGSSFNEWNNRINRMSVDFVVCAKDSTALLAIELDDKSHQKPARIEADAKKNRALADAGLQLARWNVASLPDIATIQQSIKAGNVAS